MIPKETDQSGLQHVMTNRRLVSQLPFNFKNIKKVTVSE